MILALKEALTCFEPLYIAWETQSAITVKWDNEKQRRGGIAELMNYDFCP